MLDKNNRIYFIGIGGIGMSALALILNDIGYVVQGSDRAEGERVLALRSVGIEVNIGEEYGQFIDTDLIVLNSAISEKNQELIYSKSLGCKSVMRSDLLAILVENKKTWMISGTHGKTTTTSILSHICIDNNLKPTCIVGGVLANYKTNGIWGESDIYIAEADESDGSFLKYSPECSIVTNIDNDHLDFYKSQEEIDCAFIKFMNQSKINYVNLDNEKLLKASKKVKSIVKYFSLTDNNDAYSNISEIENCDGVTKFKTTIGEDSEVFEVNMCGRFNLENILGSITVAYDNGISLKEISVSLKTFKGISRRQEIIKKTANQVIIDDYGHHPTAIREVISSLKDSYKNRKLKVIFQPHRFTRTRDFFKEFSQAFDMADELVMMNIYSAGEPEIEKITAKNLLDAIKVNDKRIITDVELVNELKLGEKPEIVLCLGAGTISKLARDAVSE